MKLKYKKTILLIFLSTMGIGILTISLSPRADKAQDNKGDVSLVADETDISPVPTKAPATPSVTVEKALSPTPSVSLSPTPFPIYSLEDSGYPEIESLIKAYYDAKTYCDIAALKTLFSDPEDVPSLDQLQEDILYKEDYRSIRCYVKKSYEDNCFIVYVYNEIKFINIDTPAPSVDRFYLITDSSGDIKIYSKQLEGERKEYYDARLFDDDVQELLKETDAKWQEARAKDEKLNNFWEALISTRDESGEEDPDN